MPIIHLTNRYFQQKGKSALVQTEFVFAGKTSTSIHTESIVIDSFYNATNISNDTTIRHNFSPYFKLYGTYEHIFRLHKKYL